MLSWYFGPGASDAQGPQDSMTLTFKGNKYYSLAREAIQNSLDAVVDESIPVTVAFSVFDIPRATLPRLFDLTETIELCRENYADSNRFVKFCDRARDVLSHEKLRCLRVADFNTKGLEYGEGKSNFYAFMEAVGYTNKKEAGSGGSFGLGKGAYYAASTISAIIASSIYGDGEFILQGKSRLTTHFFDGKKKDYTGLLGAVNGQPVQDTAGLPDELVRKEKGTDVIILGFDDDGETWKDHLIKSVLNNFWMAIWREKLIVRVEDTVIDKNNLEQTIERYFSGDLDGKINEPETWNPNPYFKAVKFSGGPNNYSFEDELPTLGSVRLSLYLKEGLQNRTLYMRKPRMTVFKRTNNRGTGYVAVFECESNHGNEILKGMENPEHNQWRPANYLDGDFPHSDAVKADAEIKEFVRSCLDKLQAQNFTVKQKIMGLDRYLSIPEDLLADEDGPGLDGSSGTAESAGISDNETAVEVVIKEKSPTKIILKPKKKVAVLETTEGTIGYGEEPVFTGQPGGSGEGEGGGQPGTVPGQHDETGNGDGNTPLRKALKLRYRAVAQTGETVPSYIVKLFTDKEAVADVEFFAGVDNDSGGDDSLRIISASTSGEQIETAGNRLDGVKLVSGENIINVAFDSDQKLALRIKSYEI